VPTATSALPVSEIVADQAPPTARPSWRHTAALFTALSTLYFAVGTVLVLRYNLFDGDGPSRVANAGYVFMSREPHLGAIGFVWNPLPSLVEIPILHLSRWIPELKTYGLAGVAQSALFMAGAAVMVRRIALDRGIGTGWRTVAVLCFALHPTIVTYGAAGMSEAALTFALIWCARHLLQWVHARRSGDLAWAGVALGVGYLARYEVVAAACGVAILVGVLAFRRSRTRRSSHAVLSALIVLFPLGTAVAVWSMSSWIVTGELFPMLSSQYGNESQINAATQGGPMGAIASDDWVIIAARLLGMQPFVILATIGAIAWSLSSRKRDPLVPAAVFGPVLLFAAWGQYTFTTFGWFRFYLAAVPLVVIVAMVCWAPRGEHRRRPWQMDSLSSRWGAALLCSSVLIGFPVTAYATLDERIGNQALQFGLRSVFDPQTYPSEEQWYGRLMTNDRALADYFDRKNLPDGSVLMDTFNTWGVWLSSDRPKQFVITSDYDFTAVMNRPWDFGVRYVVASNPANGVKDVLNRRYPDLWADGAGFGELALSVYGGTGDERLRVYRVIEPRTVPGARPVG